MSDSLNVYSIDYLRNNLRKEQKLFVDVFDKKDLSFKNSIDISPQPNNDNPLELIEIFSIRQRMVLVMVETIPNSEKRIVLQVINPDGSRQNEIIADTLPSLQNVNEDFEVVVDKTETGFVICTNYPISATENQQLKITAFDPNLRALWQKNIVFPQRDKQFLFSDWQYDGKQKIYFLARHIIDLYQPDYEFSTLSQNTYYLWGYDKQRDRLKEIDLSLHNRYISKISMKMADNRWIISGVFSNDKKFKTDGVFNLLLDSNMQVSSHVLHNFTIEEQRNFNKTRSPNANKKGIDDIQIKGIEVLANKDFVLIGEEFRKELEETNDGRMTPGNYTEVYYYNDITLFWFDSTGLLKGNYSLPKMQVSVNDRGYYSSYTLGKKVDRLYFFYNDHPKNMVLNASIQRNVKPISGNRKMYLQGVQIDDQGHVRKEIVVPPSRTLKTRPSKAIQLLDGQVYFMIQKRRSNALLKVKFD
jgi:hypothetical protein